jgi:hypothetical protein
MSVSLFFEAITIGASDGGSKGVVSVSLFAGRYAGSKTADETIPPCDPICSDSGAAWNDRDNGPVAEPSVSVQDLKNVQNCRMEL